MILSDSIWNLKGEQELDRTDENGKNFSGKENPLGQKCVRGTPSNLVWQEMSLLGRSARIRVGHALKLRTLLFSCTHICFDAMLIHKP